MPKTPDNQSKQISALQLWRKYALTVLLLLFSVRVGWSAPYLINIEKLATAIYYAEGGAKTNYPYGILTHYKHTTPRQACINTIKHALRDWDGKGDFITFLGSRYCPIGCSNDNGTNKFWVKNVKFYYRH